MPARFVVVPQWQGSGSSRSMRLIDGAEAIRGDLPSGATTVVHVPLGAGEALETGVHRYSTLSLIRERVSMALDDVRIGETPVLIGGDCGVEVAAVEHALEQDPGLAVVWFDAHADLHSADSSPSGAFHGMVARALLGEAPEGLSASPALAADRLVLAGTRVLDDAEAELLAAMPIGRLTPEELADPAALVATLELRGATAVYLHVDLDVLDPEDIAGIDFPEPFGVRTPALLAAIRAVGERFPIAGAGITEFAPASSEGAADDLPTILRILSAMTAAVRARDAA